MTIYDPLADVRPGNHRGLIGGTLAAASRRCLDGWRGHVCTRGRGHVGQHIAATPSGTGILAVWLPGTRRGVDRATVGEYGDWYTSHLAEAGIVARAKVPADDVAAQVANDVCPRCFVHDSGELRPVETKSHEGYEVLCERCRGEYGLADDDTPDEAGATLARDHVRDVLIGEDDEIGSANVDMILGKLGLSRPEPHKVVTVQVKIKKPEWRNDDTLREQTSRRVLDALTDPDNSNSYNPAFVLGVEVTDVSKADR